MAGQQSSFTYDVFLLSFCGGSDTGHGFTQNLVRALHDRGINRTFIVEYEELLPRGDEEEVLSLVKAIKQSKIAIIVFSNNDASSSLRLEALACIVDPSDVLARLDEEEMLLLKDNSEEVKLQKWRNALSHVANLSGWIFKLGYPNVFLPLLCFFYKEKKTRLSFLVYCLITFDVKNIMVVTNSL